MAPFMERKSKTAHVEDDGEFKNIISPTSKQRGLALLRQGEYLQTAYIRPDWKHILLKNKLLKKIKIEGKIHLTDGKKYPKRTGTSNRDSKD